MTICQLKINFMKGPTHPENKPTTNSNEITYINYYIMERCYLYKPMYEYSSN